MKLGINAFNIRSGGGLTHLLELLSAVDLTRTSFSGVIIWASKNTLDQLPVRNGFEKISVPALQKNWIHKLFWLFFQFPKEANVVDILFFPGGTYFGFFRPYVTMLQNMLPFEPKEAGRYRTIALKMYVKWKLLFLTQSYTLKHASGAIYPSYYAYKMISERVPQAKKIQTAIIPHGIHSRFLKAHPVDMKYKQHIRLLYVSIVDMYKHQWNVIQAVNLLRQQGYDVQLDLVGPVGNQHAYLLMKNAMRETDPSGRFIFYHGEKSYRDLPMFYQAADIFIFASSCESISSILLEAMSAGLPIACANCSAMPEILADAGVYFNPEEPKSIAGTVSKLIDDPNFRAECGRNAHMLAQKYQWASCASETFQFLGKVAQKFKEYHETTH